MGGLGVATTLPAATARPMVSLLAAGVRAVIVGGSVQVAAAGSDGHALAAPLITAGATVLAVLLGPLVQSIVRSRRNRTLARKDAEIRRLRRENERLKRGD